MLANMISRLIAGILSIVALCLADQAAPSVRVTKTIEAAIREADAIAVVKIIEMADVEKDGSKCGTKYSAEVLKTLKRNSDFPSNSMVQFGRAAGLIEGKSYILFFSRGNAPEKIYNKLISENPELATNSPKKETVRLIECNGLSSQYSFDPSLQWYLENGKAHIFAIWPKGSLPDSLRPEPLEGHSDGPYWLFKEEDLLNYISFRVNHITTDLGILSASQIHGDLVLVMGYLVVR
jgi:hypothetical protein